MNFPKVTYEKHIWEATHYARTENEYLVMQLPYKSAVLEPISKVKVQISDSLLPELLSTLEGIVRFDTVYLCIFVDYYFCHH